MEHVAHQIQGSAEPCESSALQWHRYLLHYGVSSARLCNAVAMLACHLASRIVDWECICALMASWLVGVLGFVLLVLERLLRCILCKVIALATWADQENVCGVA